MVVVAAFGQHHHPHHGEQDDGDALTNEDDHRRQADGPVSEQHRHREPHQGQPHPPNVHSDRGEQRLGYVGRARVNGACERDVDEEQDPRRDEPVGRAERGTVEGIDRSGRIERTGKDDERVGHEGHCHQAQEVGQRAGSAYEASQNSWADDDASHRTLDPD